MTSFFKFVPCLLTKALLRYAIVCSMKNVIIISWNHHVAICLGSHCPQVFKIFGIASMKWFPHWIFLWPLAYAWLRVGHSKVWGINIE
jgi:hypothetical protein